MKKIILTITLLASWSNISQANLNFRSKSATLQLAESTNIKLEHPINNCIGQVVKKQGSSIQGNDVIFNQGVLDEAGNRMKITGRLKSDSIKQITLNGNESFKGKGSTVIQSLIISGNNNRIEGDLLLNNDIQLLNNSTGVTCALLRSLSKNIQMNHGTITLNESIEFIEDKKLIGGGTVIGNNRGIILGSKETDWTDSMIFDNVNGIQLNAALHLSQTWTFSGNNCSIDGNGHFLNFEPHGKMIIDRNSTLKLKNVVLHQVDNHSLNCIDNSGKIIFQDVTLIQDGEYNFYKGSFSISGFLDISGDSIFIFTPEITCTILDNSTLFLSNGATFSYDPPSGNKNLLFLEGPNSAIRIQDSTLHVTKDGLHLTNGLLMAKNNAAIYCEERFNEDGFLADVEGLTLGDATTYTGDCFIFISPGSNLQLENGNLIYQNTDPGALQMDSIGSSITINPKTILTLNTPLIFPTGRLELYDNATLLNFSGEPIWGTVEIVKGL